VLSAVELLPISVECEALFSSVVLIVEGGGVTIVIGAGAGCEYEVVVLVSLICLDDSDSPHPLTNGMIARLSAESAIQRDALFITHFLLGSVD